MIIEQAYYTMGYEDRPMPIACLYNPRFSIDVQRQPRSDLAPRLILIGEETVFDCSLGAEVSGVRRGIRMPEAIGLCHRALVLPLDLAHYWRRFNEVLDFLGAFSPEVETSELGISYLSLHGLSVDPQPFAERLIADLHRRLGFMGSVGMAGGKFPARVAAQTTRPGLAKVVPPGQEGALLAPLSVDHLPASDSMHCRLRLLGLETIGDIAHLPLGLFQQQFGPEGKRCWELAHGIDGDPLVLRVKEQTIVRRLQLPAPAITVEAILAGLERLVYTTYGSPGRNGRWVRKAVVRAALDEGGSWELPIPFREAVSEPRDAWFAVKSAVTRRWTSPATSARS